MFELLPKRKHETFQNHEDRKNWIREKSRENMQKRRRLEKEKAEIQKGDLQKLIHCLQQVPSNLGPITTAYISSQ